MCPHPSDSVIDEKRERQIERAEIPNIYNIYYWAHMHIFHKTGNILP